ncbi:Tyrosine-protein phosphatase non-receptor type 14 [Toxocara canis]|uniref:Tyrosine-protein phosphatase non-receptor type 14 n=1 Tax=Toxocara canis TaxID=6265 RepID=A0A0B2UVQ2_TOXCA|nr:Tyrosine-protein phosphatase non-receptor type 14 [Toxocara canis]
MSTAAGQRRSKRQSKIRVSAGSQMGESAGQKPADFINIMSKLSEKQIKNQFDQLINPGRIAAQAFMENLDKNRFPVPVLDKHRVKLSEKIAGDSTYLPATYARFNRDDYTIIQSPTKHNAVDFWRMVWQDGCKLIVSVVESSSISDGDSSKCYQYWPVKTNKSMDISNGRFSIKLSRKKEEKGYTIYEMVLTAHEDHEGTSEGNTSKTPKDDVGTGGDPDDASKPRKIFLLHVTEWDENKWPDIDAIASCVTFLHRKWKQTVIQAVDDYVPPVVIQGHAAINRSCAIWVAANLAKQVEQKECFDVEYLMRALIRVRPGAFTNRTVFFATFAIAFRLASMLGWSSPSVRFSSTRIQDSKERIKEIKAAAMQ